MRYNSHNWWSRHMSCDAFFFFFFWVAAFFLSKSFFHWHAADRVRFIPVSTKSLVSETVGKSHFGFKHYIFFRYSYACLGDSNVMVIKFERHKLGLAHIRLQFITKEHVPTIMLSEHMPYFPIKPETREDITNQMSSTGIPASETC